MIAAILILTILGILCGLGLSYAAKVFFVPKDPRQQEVLDNLPGSNCGACGHPGCSAMSASIISGVTDPSSCPSATSEMLAVIGGIMGIEVTMAIKEVPKLLCAGNDTICKPMANYNGPKDCHVMTGFAGGGKPCGYGCMGGGSCVTVCDYDAIFMSVDGLPYVDYEKCISCALCVKECPRGLLVLRPINKTVVVECNSHDRGVIVRSACDIGCIGCGICVRNCPDEAIELQDSLSVIDVKKCTVCGICVEKCPRKCIRNIEYTEEDLVRAKSKKVVTIYDK